ncbi:YeaH/YhbH family protein [Rhodoferax sp.]|uniref:YeaH/YhbH family protein n=1 Tax=Rhodoferax sp. TaxID=50421 RepID=UPI002719B8DA|nr:YeaH/YhbH family protein [Rhodoferax sp.]MDO9194855.1 YeaH/YhbH family protein [Rhodoferax sp.]
MTVRIIDRRFDSKHKSSVNRGRFIDRFKGQIRKAVADAINKRGIRDIENGEKIGIPGKDIAEPQFEQGRGGVWETVRPGNDRFSSGDQVDRPQGGAGGQGKGQASQDGEGLDEFLFTLTKDEFLDIFFDELALPHLVKQHLAHVEQYRRVRAGYTQSGVPTNINLARTMRGAAGRRIAVGGPYAAQLRALMAELDEKKNKLADDDPELERLRREIVRLHAKMDKVPFVDSFDLRYTNRIRVPQPSTQAVMFCLLDVSGSMDESRKNIAKRFFMLLYLFLTRNYERIDVVFIRHHTVASEVDEDEFFTSRESGGTVVSSALELMHKIITDRYPSSQWNIYGAQASDGDNWNDDSPRCRELLEQKLLPLTQYFAYIEITEGPPQNLWEEYSRLEAAHGDHFAMRRIATVADIYPVFRDLFKRQV